MISLLKLLTKLYIKDDNLENCFFSIWITFIVTSQTKSVESKLNENMLILREIKLQAVCQGHINSFTPGQNGRHFADNIFRCIFFEWKFTHFD